MSDLTEGVGRIVKGVNTTPDVGPNQTSIEAAKFGFKVDKDGRPPVISKKSKNNPNTLFNLGLTEGIKLRLERDKHIDILHITDTEDSQRIEVRGKKGYESNGYDPKDKLHQVLDRVGRAANISELMNGEVVSINPNHPQGARAIRTAQDVLQTENKFTDMEWAIIEGGHSLEDLTPKTKKSGDIFTILEASYNNHVGHDDKLSMPANTLVIDTPGDLDWYKLGQHFPTLNKADPSEFGQSDSDTVISFQSEEEKQAFLKIAAKLGLKIKDIGGTATHPEIHSEMTNESLDNPYPFNLQGPDSSHNFAATAETPNGVLRMDFEAIDYDDFGIDFAVGKSMGKTEAGDEFRVFATVVAMMKKWINTVGIEHVESFDFGANKDEHASDGRAKLYARFAKKLADQLGWKLEQSTTRDRNTAFFKLTNPKPVPRHDDHWDNLEDNPDLEENFADGKKKGKSRPGRVKKSGASCNGSVTALRKRAKNASGEKAKMYHWCANMKSGKKKK